MPASFGPSSPDQTAEVRQFLLDTFGSTEIPPTFTQAAMDWKYFQPHPLWAGGRSYTLRTPEGIAAHGCISPLRFSSGGREVDSMMVIDWASGRLIPGAGLQVFRKCLETSGGTLLTIGGSVDTLKIIPKLKWFARQAEDIRTYARPLRPRLHFARSRKSLRDVARLLRNLYWRLSPALPGSAGWRCRVAAAGEEVFNPAGDSAPDFAPIVRTRAWFDYLLDCPVVKMELVILENGGTACGHALLANAGGSVRVADFVVGGDASHADRVAAFAGLVRYIAAQKDTAEIIAGSSLEEACHVFEECGLRGRGNAPVYLADPKKLLAPETRLEITPLIGDAFYLFDPAYPFVC